MKAMMKRCSFLVYIMIFDLAGLPLPQALAKTKEAVTTPEASAPQAAQPAYSDLPAKYRTGDEAAAPLTQAQPKTQMADPELTNRPRDLPRASTGGKPRVAVIELTQPDSDPKQVEKITDTVRDQLSDSDAFAVISKDATRSFFASNPNVLQRIDVANPLNRYLDQAKEFYKNSDFKDAIGVLSNTIDTYRAAQPPLTENFLLVDAYVYLGNVYMGNTEEKDAKNVFKEAVRLDPDKEITEEKYPPKTVGKFIQSKQEYLSKARTTQLDIFSNPKGAEIIVNGVSKGEAPVKLDRFTMGEHFIIAQKAGFKPVAQKIVLKDNYTRVKLEMEKDEQKVTQGEGLTVNDLSNVDEQVEMASKVGNLIGADKVVLVSMQEIGYNHKITARMIDMKYHASYKPKSVEVLDLPSDTRPAAGVIAKDLTAMAEVDLGQNSKKYADSEVIVIGKKKKKSLLKSPILWGVIGAVVVGGATSAIMLGRGGGDDGGNNTTVSVSGSTQRN